MSTSSEVEIPKLVKPKKKSKDKGKKKANKASQSSLTAVDDGKNEGEDPNWAYNAPEGAVEIDHSVDVGCYDWDAVNKDDNLELWIIRVPEGLKPKYLENAVIDSVPSTSAGTTRIGGINKKHTAYDVWSVGEQDYDQKSDEVVWGEEIKGLSCLLPRKKKGGKLFRAPKPIARHIVVSEKPILRTPDQTSGSDNAEEFKNPPRQTYPKELLKHRFMPYGSLRQDEVVPMDVVEHPESLSVPQTQTATQETDRETANEEKKQKKRKSDGEAMKKSKKAKKAT